MTTTNPTVAAANNPPELPAGPEAVSRHAGRSLWSDAALRIFRDRSAVVCLAVIVVYALIAVIAPLCVPDWKNTHDYDRINLPPSWQSPLGTDALGRSVLTKTLLGANTSMTVALLANLIAVPLGMAVGAAAGYFGKTIDDVIVWLYSTLLSIPGIILLIAIRFAFKDKVWHLGPHMALDLDQGLGGMAIALGVLSWIGTCRLVRAETMKIRELDYVLAARAIGTHPLTILRRHILPNVMHIGLIQFSLGFIGAITAEVMLSYLGLGVGPGVPSWGSMINSARMDLVVGRWWELTSAVGAMFMLVLALNIFGDRLRDAFDPRLRTI